jgi:hypothetical protein
MSVICVTIINSEEEVIAGIPRTVTITTNIPALIFYTLDGCVPTLFSTQYIGPIFLSTQQQTIILNVLATNGTYSSPIITEIYQTDLVDGNTRFAHNNTNAPPGYNLQQLYPYGDNPIHPEVIYSNPADVGVTVDNPALPSISTGFDGQGNPNAFTNQPYDMVNYNIIYPTQNAEGEGGLANNTLPGKVQSNPPVSSIGPEQTDQFSNTFDPKAFVIFQDASQENPNDPLAVNRMHFTLENNERARDGNAYFNTALDAPPVSGTFLRSHYNPRTNETTYYYIDTWTNRWIISTQPNNPIGPFDGNLATKYTTGDGAGVVFEWLTFTRRVLF